MTESQDGPLTGTDPLMLREAREVPAVVARQEENAPLVRELAAFLSRRPPRLVATVARGSSDHACTVLKYALETHLGWPTLTLAPSVQTLYGVSLPLSGALVLAVSQSGASPDVVETLRAAGEQGALTVALTNAPQSDLARAAQVVLPLRCGEEQAVAATKSFVASVTALLPLLLALNPDAALERALGALPDTLGRALTLEARARALAAGYAGATDLLLLGRGLHLGVAGEAALKLKETSGLHAEAVSVAEFSHGPRRLLAEGLPLLGFCSADAAWPATQEGYAALRSAGARLTTLGPAEGSDLPTPPSGHALCDPTVSALAFYLLAGHLALARGLDPDHPPLLSKVTRTR